MNRRTLLKGTGGIAASIFMARDIQVFAQGTPGAEGFPSLTITVTDDGFDIPAGLTAGRYAVDVINAGTTPSHSSMGLLPDGVTQEQVLADMSSESEAIPDWLLHAGYVGLPDFPPPGATRSGVIDLAAGDYFIFDPFSTRLGFNTVGAGDPTSPEPISDATVVLTEMHFVLPETGLPVEPARLKIENTGAIPHEFQVLPVPAGTTTDQIEALFALPEDATPAPDDELGQMLAAYQPVAATSILAPGHTSWLDADIEPGTYAVICALPFPDGVPHAMLGMLEIVTLT